MLPKSLLPKGTSDLDPRFVCLAIVETKTFSVIVALVVTLDLVFLLLENSPSTHDSVGFKTFVGINAFIATFFALETVAKLFAYGIIGFFQTSLNIIEFTVSCLTVFGFLAWISDDPRHNGDAGSISTPVRFVVISRLLRFFVGSWAFNHDVDPPVLMDRVKLPANKAIVILNKFRQLLRMRYVAILTQSRVTPQEISWVIHATSSCRLMQPFQTQGMDRRLNSFLTQTFTIAPLIPTEPPHTPFPRAFFTSTSLLGNRNFLAKAKRHPTQVQLWEFEAVQRLTTWCDTHDNPKEMEAGQSVKLNFDTEKLAIELSKFDSWTFDPFAIKEFSDNVPLFVVGYVAISKLGLVTTLNLSEPILKNFLWIANSMHRDNLYHSSTHVSDVTQTTYYFLSQLGLQSLLTPLDVFACIIAAIVHDLDHPGVNNPYLHLSQDPLTHDYTNSTIENYSIRLAFELIKQERCDIFHSLTASQVAYVRHRIIQLVLITDNARHFELLGKFKAFHSNNTLNIDNPDHRLLVMQVAVHCADISNPAKPLELSRKWSGLVQAEFWWQGDKERALGHVPFKFFDRSVEHVNVALCQLGFIVSIVEPIFVLWLEFVRQHVPHAQCDQILQCLQDNKRFWSQGVVDQKRRKLSTGSVVRG